MCRTKVKPHFRGKYVGRFLIHSTGEMASKVFLGNQESEKGSPKDGGKRIRVNSPSVCRVTPGSMPPVKKEYLVVGQGRRGGMALNSLCLLKCVSTIVCNLFRWDHITFSVPFRKSR